MKKQTVNSMYDGFHWVSAISGMVIFLSLVGYYSLNELGIRKYNGLIRTLMPVALIEFVVSVGAVNFIDYQQLKNK